MAENRREIQTPAGTFRLTEEASREQAPPPELQERVRRDMQHSAAVEEALVGGTPVSDRKLGMHLPNGSRIKALPGIGRYNGT